MRNRRRMRFGAWGCARTSVAGGLGIRRPRSVSQRHSNKTLAGSTSWSPMPACGLLKKCRWLSCRSIAGAQLSMRISTPYFCLPAMLPLVRAGGRVVIVSSTAGQRGEAFHADYAATKGALISLTKSLALEYAPGITVNCVAPGWVDTEMSAPAFTAENRDRIRAGIPVGRIATAEDVAGPILFLCSALARHITGEVLNVNGGSVLCG